MSTHDIRTAFGAGARHQAAPLLAHAGAERVLILAQARWTGLAAELAGALGARHVATFDRITTQVPEGVVEAVRALVERHQPDWMLTVGGSSTIGVAKALALDIDAVQIAAIPTTYAGSEHTNIWGRLQGGHKRTGRDDRVRPRVVIHDPELQQSLPVRASQESLLNALAHSIEALYAANATDAARAAARQSLPLLWNALSAVAEAPTDPSVRSQALRGAALASTALDGASMALHHKLAHVLGGCFGTPHGATHATLLPYTLAFNQSAAPELCAAFEQTLGITDPGSALYDRMRALGLSVSLSDLGLSTHDVEQAATHALEQTYPNPKPFTRDDLAGLLHGARLGRRPTPRTARVALPNLQGVHAAEPASLWPADTTAPQTVVLAVHGRGANADRFIAQLAARVPHASQVQFLAPQAALNRWYPKGMAAPLADNQPDLDDALAALDAAWCTATARVNAAQVVVCGFSQGACLALTWLSQRKVRPGAVLALSGAALPGLAGDFSHLRGVPVHLGISVDDPWVPQELWSDTARALLSAGAQVAPTRVPGHAHQIHPPDVRALANA
ncbi:MAG: hypothetical protein CL927_00610, partial [Deltaproteobacteria bacterium]|nr:hypothetical protein [Deltaproteobacteria bacterium]